MSKTPEYKTWFEMRARCNDARRACYKDYGGRGIKVCKEWEVSFESFFASMGQRPSDKHSIDRINVNGDYEPSNCRWTTFDVQINNKRNSRKVAYLGSLIGITELSQQTGMPQSSLHRLIVKRGLTAEQAINRCLLLQTGKRPRLFPVSIEDVS
jgi:hypothetical protein